MDFGLMDERDDVERTLVYYKELKQDLMYKDYDDFELQSSYRKIRHHLDRMILRLEALLLEF
jgi:hypothetical protein